MHLLPVAEEEIKEMVDAETKAWSSQNVDKLLDLFHVDMVWPWPMTAQSHDPVDWIFELSRFDRNRWKKVWTELLTRIGWSTTCVRYKRSSFQNKAIGHLQSLTWARSGRGVTTELTFTERQG